MTTEFTPSPELKNAVLSALLQTKEERGEVPAADVRDAVRVLGCSERTVWRWLQKGSAPTHTRKRWEPNESYSNLLLRHGGSVADLRETLVDEGQEKVCARTMQRAFAREYAAAYLTFTRKGYEAAAAQLPTTAMPDLAVNEEWSMDDTQLPVWCILPNGEVVKAQMQGIMDGGSRYIVGLNVSPYYFTTEDAVENLASAMAGHYTENGVFVGGKPRSLRTDRGSIFVSHATSLGLIAADIARRYSEDYTPQQNGKIERWHRWKRVFKKLPGFDWSDFKKGDPRKAVVPPPKEDLLTFEELVVEVAREVRKYNNRRVHSAHNMTPAACWEQEVAANPTLVKPANGVAIRAAMRQEIDRKLLRRRVQHANRHYNLHPQSVQDPNEDPKVVARRKRLIDATEGKDVKIRFLHGRVEYVSVYNTRGHYLGDAVWDEIQTVKQAGDTANVRREHIKTMTLSIEAIAKADAEAVAARRKEVLDSLDAGEAHYDQYDDDTTDTATGTVPRTPAPGAPGDTSGRKSRTAKKKPVKRKAGSSAQPTARERAEERRRQDLEEAAAYSRDKSA